MEFAERSKGGEYSLFSFQDSVIHPKPYDAVDRSTSQKVPKRLAKSRFPSATVAPSELRRVIFGGVRGKRERARNEISNAD